MKHIWMVTRKGTSTHTLCFTTRKKARENVKANQGVDRMYGQNVTYRIVKANVNG